MESLFFSIIIPVLIGVLVASCGLMSQPAKRRNFKPARERKF